MEKMIIASVLPKDMSELKQIKQTMDKKGGRDLPDLLEIRLDLLDPDETLDIIRAIPGRKIAACRAKRDGGRFEGSEEERIGILEKALRSGQFDLLDIEAGSEAVKLMGMGRQQGMDREQKFIISHHDFQGTPEDLSEVYETLKSVKGAFLYKLVPFAAGVSDNLVVKEILKRAVSEKVPLISFCTGPEGIFSRIMALSWGSRGIYASLRAGSETAPGQLSYRELQESFDARKIGPATGIFGVLGYPLKHSLSPAVHNAAYRELRMDFVCIPLETRSIDGIFKHADAFQIAGFAVTSPFKKEVLRFAGEVDEAAGVIGAANTIIRKESRFRAYNTDAAAFSEDLKRLVDVRSEKVAVLGDGGAAGSVVYALKKERSTIHLFSRNKERGESLSERSGCPWHDLKELKDFDYSILINCTTSGLYPDIESSPVEEDFLRGKLVYDLIYNPSQTKLMKMASSRGIAVENGAGMFVKQAALQFELLTGTRAPELLMAQIVRDKTLFLDKG